MTNEEIKSMPKAWTEDTRIHGRYLGAEFQARIGDCRYVGNTAKYDLCFVEPVITHNGSREFAEVYANGQPDPVVTILGHSRCWADCGTSRCNA